ncbi:3'(2'),5'-bisphosphate nucleotidase CysQ [Celeribacter marinus]|uniref:3'(2'),5'-bisphosphate nucleotidase CysQ n=1 Tax=Celeribacter marinus TaxID=1397108 RepID=UPI003F6CBF6B
MPETDDLSLLIDAALEAGRIATPYWKSNPEVWDKGDGAGPVTEADLAVDRHLFDRFATARPTYGWLSEETADTAERLGKDRVVIVDPIDGTRSFIQGDTNWAHSLAIVERGEVVAAVVYLPLRDRLFAATTGGGATLNGDPIHVSGGEELNGASVLVKKGVLDAEHWQDGPPAFVHKFRPSLAYRLALVAQGRYDAMITLRPTWEWDVAAGSLIMEEAGGVVLDRAGQRPVFNQPHPATNGLVAGSAALSRAIVERLKPT